MERSWPPLNLISTWSGFHRFFRDPNSSGVFVAAPDEFGSFDMLVGDCGDVQGVIRLRWVMLDYAGLRWSGEQDVRRGSGELGRE